MGTTTKDEEATGKGCFITFILLIIVGALAIYMNRLDERQVVPVEAPAP